MSAQPLLPFVKVRQHRESKKQQIERFFADVIGRPFPSFVMHERWGTSFRTRVSEINRDSQATIVIRNKHDYIHGKEVSVYWAELKSTS